MNECCCRFHCPARDDLPALCDDCRSKLEGLSEHIHRYVGKYLVTIVEPE